MYNLDKTNPANNAIKKDHELNWNGMSNRRESFENAQLWT